MAFLPNQCHHGVRQEAVVGSTADRLRSPLATGRMGVREMFKRRQQQSQLVLAIPSFFDVRQSGTLLI